jgi:AraC family transcriptional regulator
LKSSAEASFSRRYVDLGRMYLLTKGTPLLIRPQAVGENRHFACILSPQIIDQAGLANVLVDHPFSGVNMKPCQFRPFLDVLMQEMTNPGFSSQLLIEAIGISLGVTLSRTLAERTHSHEVIGGLADWQLRRIKEMIADNDKIPTVAELAAHCGVGERHLMRCFKQSTGSTLYKFAENIRIEKAKALLENSVPIKMIADRLGFQNAGNFSTAFKRAVTISPSQYRGRNRAMKS